MGRFRTPAEVLTEWRSAVQRLGRARRGTPEDATLEAEVDGLRAEYHRRVAELLHDDTKGAVESTATRTANRRPRGSGGSGGASNAA